MARFAPAPGPRRASRNQRPRIVPLPVKALSEPIPFVVSIDTEEDNWEPSRAGLSVENIREVPSLIRLLERLGLRATFFTTYQVARQPWAARILQDAKGSGIAEIAAHLHPWNTPPDPAAEPPHPTMLNNYAPEAQLDKVRHLTRHFIDAFDFAPTAFRAGRFGFNKHTASVLIRCGYRVDSSVTPYLSWERFDDGPTFVGAPLAIYRLDGSGDVRQPVHKGPLIEVPLSVGYTRFPPRHWNTVAWLSGLRGVRWTHLPGLAARTGFVMRAILSPETNSVQEMIALSRRLIEGGASHLHLFFHSSSLSHGLNPFAKSKQDVDRLYDDLERYVEWLRKAATIRPATVSEAASIALG